MHITTEHNITMSYGDLKLLEKILGGLSEEVSDIMELTQEEKERAHDMYAIINRQP